MKISYQGEEKQRLDKFLHEQNPDHSRNQIQKYILDDQVTVNGQKTSVHFWLKKNDQVAYDFTKQQTDDKIIAKPKIKKETADYIIIEKPSGLLVHPTDKGEQNTLIQWLLAEYPQVKNISDDPQRPGLVQRLDRDVSGLMVIPLTKNFYENIKSQFMNRTVTKEYLCLVHGQVLNNQGEIKTSLARDKRSGLIKAHSDGQGIEAHTIYEIAEKYTNYTLLKVQIKTGRTHQIRTHLYSIGHSVVGDKLYQTKDIRKKKKQVDIRIFLHAHLLKFLGPDEKTVKCTSPLPKELKNFLKDLK